MSRRTRILTNPIPLTIELESTAIDLRSWRARLASALTAAALLVASMTIQMVTAADALAQGISYVVTNVTNTASPEFERFSSINNDGDIAFEDSAGVSLYDHSTGLVRPLAVGGKSPSLNNNGIVVYHKLINLQFDLFIYDTNTDVETRITNTPTTNESSGKISDTGHIAYVFNPNNGNINDLEIYLLPAGSGTPINVSNDSVWQRFPSEVNDEGDVIFLRGDACTGLPCQENVSQDIWRYDFQTGTRSQLSFSTSSELVTEPTLNNAGDVAWVRLTYFPSPTVREIRVRDGQTGIISTVNELALDGEYYSGGVQQSWINEAGDLALIQCLGGGSCLDRVAAYDAASGDFTEVFDLTTLPSQPNLTINDAGWIAFQASGDIYLAEKQVCTPEVCDGVDNDCDGDIDEDIPDIVSGQVDTGVCQPEIQQCIGGSFQVTQSQVDPSPEICDGLDNDCDGGTDDPNELDFDADADGANSLDSCFMPSDCDDNNPALQTCNTPTSDGPVTLPPIMTPVGDVTVELPNVTAGGDTSTAQIDCSEIPEGGLVIPGPNAVCAEVITSEGFDFDGFATICIPYEDNGTCDGTEFPGIMCTSDLNCGVDVCGGGGFCVAAPGQACATDAECRPTCVDPLEDSRRMVRYPQGGGAPEVLANDPVVGLDKENNILCALTDEFSDFATGYLTDGDFDFLPDLLDNCPTIFNIGQEDLDLDQVGDACDVCFAAPNGPGGGTCTFGDFAMLGLGCTLSSECGTGGVCSNMEEDLNMNGAVDACDPDRVPLFTTDVFETPACWAAGTCSPADFPLDWGVVRTFEYDVPDGGPIEDAWLFGTWGGDVFDSTAPVEIYLEGILITECVEFDPCWQSGSTVDWNGGRGFLLSSLGVDFTDPSVQADFADGSAELSVIQNDVISAHFSNLKLYVPEPGTLTGLMSGGLFLAWMGSMRRGRQTRKRD